MFFKQIIKFKFTKTFNYLVLTRTSSHCKNHTNGQQDYQARLSCKKRSQKKELEDQVVYSSWISIRVLCRSNGKITWRRDSGTSYLLLSFQDAKPKGVIALDSDCSVDVALLKQNSFQVVTKTRTFYISASNSTLRDQWIGSIREIVN